MYRVQTISREGPDVMSGNPQRLHVERPDERRDKDIVRTAWRHAERIRNDASPQSIGSTGSGSNNVSVSCLLRAWNIERANL